MKKDILILIAAISMIGISVLRSQDAPTTSPLQTLQAVKAANGDLIDQQKKTLDGLDDTEKTAETIKTLGKRS